MITPLRHDSGTIYDSVHDGAGRAPVAGTIKSGKMLVIPKATILIVDDEPDVREVLEEYFVAHGYAAIGAESASAAKALAAQHRSTWRWSTSTCPARTA